MAVITGSYGNDTLQGSEASDVFIAGAGDDLMFGKDGIDVLEVDGHSSMFTVVRDGNALEVYDDIGPRYGDDRLVDFERIRFPDVSLAFDFDGPAGTVAQLIGAIFGADAINETYAGVGMGLLDGGMDAELLASLALQVRLGSASPTNAAVVNVLYENLTGRVPTLDEAAPFVQMLEAGMSQGELALMAAGTGLNLGNIDFAGLQAQGLRYFE